MGKKNTRGQRRASLGSEAKHSVPASYITQACETAADDVKTNFCRCVNHSTIPAATQYHVERMQQGY
eukprot:scaffold481640_cov18-Prasinocladus_malaysianus.AAC.1